MTPTMIEGMPFKEYLNDPCETPSLTSSAAKSLLSTCPAKVWINTPRFNKDLENSTEDRFSIGAAAHALITKDGDPFHVVDAKDWRTNKAKEQKQTALDAGLTPLLKDQHKMVKRMAEIAEQMFGLNDDVALPMSDPASIREGTIIWEQAGVEMRARPDFFDVARNTIVHYKTTGENISPHGFSRYAYNQSWHIIHAHYAAAGLALTGKEPRQLFAVQETSEPYLCAVYELDAEMIAGGVMMWNRAVDIWARCTKKNEWPGYPIATMTLTAPNWFDTNTAEQKDRMIEIDKKPSQAAIQRWNELNEKMRQEMGQ